MNYNYNNVQSFGKTDWHCDDNEIVPEILKVIEKYKMTVADAQNMLLLTASILTNKTIFTIDE